MLRKSLALFVILSCVIAFGHFQPPSEAQGKKDDLAKQVQKLQQQLKEKDQTINKLEAQIQKLKALDKQEDAKLQQRIKQLEADLKKKGGTPDKNATQLRKDLDAANQTIREKDQLITTLQQKAPKATADLTKQVEALRKSVKDLEGIKNAPVIHSMILKLKKSDEAQIKRVSTEADKTLGKVAGVRGVWIGKPAETSTPEPSQQGYQLGVIVLLDDPATLQKFLDDPLHKQFIDQLADAWERPIVYDIQRDLEKPKN